MSYGISFGVIVVWSSVININLNTVNVGEVSLYLVLLSECMVNVEFVLCCVLLCLVLSCQMSSPQMILG